MRYSSTEAPRFFHIRHKPSNRSFKFKPVPVHFKVLIAMMISALVYVPILSATKPVRVGDGSEYYAMALAWSETHRPYMTTAAWEYYDQLYRSNAIPGINTAEELKSYSPRLMLNKSQDFNHFWFYSLGAALFVEIGDYTGITIPVHTGFMLLHSLLLAGLLFVAWQLFGWRGLLAALVLTFLSPALWYLDKVHTEFFTFCMTTIAVILFIKNRFLLASLFLAMGGTQNPSFSIISLAVLGYWLVRHLKFRLRLHEIFLAALTLSVTALHPLYYFFRFGVLDPQFLAGVAAVGNNLAHVLTWFFDPDLGLLPNWPLAVILSLFAVWILIKRRQQINVVQYFFFYLMFVSVSLLAQSSTVNLNSGASPGLARYATWYIGLFFPIAVTLIRSTEKTDFKLSVLILLLGFSALYSARNFWPWGTSTAHCHPSAVSYWVQKNVPWLYSPPPEVFTERYSGICETASAKENIAVIGPDCRKVLVSNPTGRSGLTITGAAGCGYDFSKLGKLIDTKISSGEWTTYTAYQQMTRQDASGYQFDPIPGIWYSVAFGQSLAAAVGVDPDAWSLLGKDGVWTVGSQSTLLIPCPRTGKVPNAIEIELEPFLVGKHTFVGVELEIDQQSVWAGILEEERTIQRDLPAGSCVENENMSMRILVANPVSRAELGISGDLSKLGVRISRVRYLKGKE